VQRVCISSFSFLQNILYIKLRDYDPASEHILYLIGPAELMFNCLLQVKWLNKHLSKLWPFVVDVSLKYSSLNLSYSSAKYFAYCQYFLISSNNHPYDIPL
jgi:hypothetical protein